MDWGALGGSAAGWFNPEVIRDPVGFRYAYNDGFGVDYRFGGGLTSVTVAVLAETFSSITDGKFANGADTRSYDHARSEESYAADDIYRTTGAEMAAALGVNAQQESFLSYFGERVMNGQVRDDILTFGGSLVSSFTFGFVEPDFVDRSSSAFDVGQYTSLVLGGAGLIRSAYFVGVRGASAVASASGSKILALGLSGTRNISKLLTNPALLFNTALRRRHVIPASQRLSEAGSVSALARKIGTTNTSVDRVLIPLTPFSGAAFND